MPIRFWYWVKDTTYRLNRWVELRYTRPYEQANRSPVYFYNIQYHLVKTIPCTPEETARTGITARKIYVSRG